MQVFLFNKDKYTKDFCDKLTDHQKYEYFLDDEDNVFRYESVTDFQNEFNEDGFFLNFVTDCLIYFVAD